MNTNNISNFGDGNVFNQNIGDRSIYGMNLEELAQQWQCSKDVSDRALRKRMKRSFLQIAIAVLALGVCVLVAWQAGAFETASATAEFVTSISVQSIVSLIGLIVGLALGGSGVVGILDRDGAEIRSVERRGEISRWVEDNGLEIKEWKAALKRARGD